MKVQITKKEFLEQCRLDYLPELLESLNTRVLSTKERRILLKKHIKSLDANYTRVYNILKDNASRDLYTLISKTFSFYFNIFKAPFVLTEKLDNYFRKELPKSLMNDFFEMHTVQMASDLEKKLANVSF